MATIEELESLRWDLRRDCVDIIMAGAGGHIGGDMSVIDALMTLYANHLNISPETVDDPNRDRFVLSKGHAMEAYYAVLCNEGYLDLDDVKTRFSKFGSTFFISIFRLVLRCNDNILRIANAMIRQELLRQILVEGNCRRSDAAADIRLVKQAE